MMNKKEIFRKIGSIITEINEQYQYLADNPEMLNDLELELFSANADFLAEHVKVLKKINLALASKEEQKPQAETNTFAEESVSAPADTYDSKPEEPSQAPVSDNIPQTAVSLSTAEQPEALPASQPHAEVEESAETSYSPAEETELRETGTSAAELQPAPEVTPVLAVEPTEAPRQPLVPEMQETVVREVVIPEKVTNVEISQREVQSSPAVPQTLNDLISAQKAASAAVTTNVPISDLKAAISLNDKLLFIKDLFNGYSLAYSEAVELLNRFDSFEAADNFLKSNYAVKNNWAARQTTVDKFYELLNRRFPK